MRFRLSRRPLPASLDSIATALQHGGGDGKHTGGMGIGTASDCSATCVGGGTTSDCGTGLGDSFALPGRAEQVEAMSHIAQRVSATTAQAASCWAR